MRFTTSSQINLMSYLAAIGRVVAFHLPRIGSGSFAWAIFKSTATEYINGRE